MIKRESLPYSFKANGKFNLKIQDVDTEKRTIKAVGNAYNYMDSQLDVLQTGAAKKSIQEMGPESTGGPKIKHALFHDLTQLPGKMTRLSEENVNINGENVMCLCFESKLADTTLGNDTLTNYNEGIYDNHSIGFKYVKVTALDPESHGNSDDGKAWNQFKDTILNADEYGELSESSWDKRVLQVHEIKLYEISTVAFGANPLTPYLGKKSLNPTNLWAEFDNRLKKLNQIIKKGTQSDDMMFNIQAMILQLQAIKDGIFGDEDIRKYLGQKGAEPINVESFDEKLKGFTF